jgi:glycosyltransferase involved in cell wall biosynthesis
MNNRKNILWLVSWYPNNQDPFDGDFIQRHAKVAAIKNNIYVLFVIGAQQNNEEIINNHPGLCEHLIYFRKKTGLIGKYLNQIEWFFIYKKAISNYIKKNGFPDLVHVHVPWKAGLIALFIKKVYNIPFALSEHWGIYNEVAEDNYFNKPFFIKAAIKKIYKEAFIFISVSNYLAEGVNKYVCKKKYIVIPNVVDTSMFNLQKQKAHKFTFIHVSNMVTLKGISLLLNSFKLSLASTPGMHLIMVGNKDDKYVHEAKQFGLTEENITFKGEVTYSVVSELMRLSHCLIISSKIENSPCVIAEALCCGLPVIATGVGGIPEMINSNNGILVSPNNEKALSNAINKIVNNYPSFDFISIKDAAHEKYSYDVISKKFDIIYSLNTKENESINYI